MQRALVVMVAPGQREFLLAVARQQRGLHAAPDEAHVGSIQRPVVVASHGP